MADHDPLDPRVWQTWRDGAPPADFVDKVMAARAGFIPARRPSSRVRRAALIAIVAGAAAVAVMAFRSAAPRQLVGERTLAARDQIAIGHRAVAVAEAGSALGWQFDRSGAHVQQPRGDVFYRVEPGAAFVVETPLGRVTVRGTCFRVAISEEDAMRASKRVLGGAAVGAVAAATLVVVVYEGIVRVENARGAAEVQAGQSARVAGDRAPSLDDGTAAAVQAPELGEPSPSASREELLARDRTQRDQITALKVRIGRLEADLGGMQRRGPGPEPREMFDIPPDELKAMAARCEVRYALPDLRSDARPPFDPRHAGELGLSAPELARLNEAFATRKERFLREVHALYLEATGDAAGAESLDVQAMATEIEHKSADTDAIRKRLAEERAGLRPPPADPRAGGPYERYLRLAMNAAPDFERALAAVIGAERVRALREPIFGSRHVMAGCPGEE